MSSQLTVFKKYIENDETKKRMKEMLDKNATSFLSSLVNVVNGNSYLQKCDPGSIMSAAFVAAALKLPVDPNLGFSYIIPYGSKAQFQIGYKGFIQLAIRSGQYKSINVSEVYADELDYSNPITGEVVFTDPKTWRMRYDEKSEPIGYYARFELVSGFISSTYWSRKQVDVHAKRYSKSYAKDIRDKKKDSVWSDNFDAMAKKTVLKMLLSHYGILSTEMQEAITKDQSSDDGYIDNTENVVVDVSPNKSEVDNLMEGIL